MIHTVGEQIQGNETRNVRDWGPRLGENRGGRVGKLDSTSSLRLDKDPRWAREVGNVRLYSCRSSVCWRVIHVPRACAVLGCWRQAVAWQQSPARCLLPCIRPLREKKLFNSFTSFSRWKWFISNEKWFVEYSTVPGVGRWDNITATPTRRAKYNLIASRIAVLGSLTYWQASEKGCSLCSFNRRFILSWPKRCSLLELLWVQLPSPGLGLVDVVAPSLMSADLQRTLVNQNRTTTQKEHVLDDQLTCDEFFFQTPSLCLIAPGAGSLIGFHQRIQATLRAEIQSRLLLRELVWPQGVLCREETSPLGCE